MSYILQALARSEKERRQKDTPDFEDAFIEGEREGASRAPGWSAIFLTIGVATLTTILVLKFLDSKTPEYAADDPAARMAETSTPPAISAVPPNSIAQQPQETSSNKEPADEIANDNTLTPTEDAEIVAPAERPEVENEIAEFIPLSNVSEIAIIEPPVDPVHSLPGIELNIHIFSDDPAKRFVYINGKRHSEGDTIRENDGLIREITADGVIIDLGERRVLLNRIR